MANIKITELSELLTVNQSNTILYAADLSVSPNVSHFLRVGTISSLTDYSIANAAFVKANTALSVGFNANTALNISNLGFAKANAAHIQSNTATAISTSAYNSSNNVSITAQLAYNRGNTAFNHAQASFNLANTTTVNTSSSFNRANAAFSHASSSFNLANTINLTPVTVLSQSAFNRANNAVAKSGDTITGIITSPTAANNTSNTMLATTQFVQNAISSRPVPNLNIGIGQTWQNVTTNRVFNIDYTNDTGKPIMLVGEFNRNAVSTANIDLIIGGIQVPLARNTNSRGGNNSAGSLIIPPGAVYRLVNVGEALTSYKIFELR
jgi:hypothetical protein